MPNNSMAIANEFLKMPGAVGRLTQMQLLKLVYIAHGWNLAVNGAPLIAEPVRAWDYGPVIRDLYEHVKFYGSNPIQRPIADTDREVYRFFGSAAPKQSEVYKAHLSEPEQDVVNRVWHRYGSYSGPRLSSLTHKPGTPWFQTYFGEGKNHVIPNERIREHYIELAKAVG
jgi:uncharacterized phage-associated protein